MAFVVVPPPKIFVTRSTIEEIAPCCSGAAGRFVRAAGRGLALAGLAGAPGLVAVLAVGAVFTLDAVLEFDATFGLAAVFGFDAVFALEEDFAPEAVFARAAVFGFAEAFAVEPVLALEVFEAEDRAAVEPVAFDLAPEVDFGRADDEVLDFAFAVEEALDFADERGFDFAAEAAFGLAVFAVDRAPPELFADDAFFAFALLPAEGAFVFDALFFDPVVFFAAGISFSSEDFM